MDKIDVSSISQPSDLFGKEILPEYTFESEYGKLKFNAVVVPDFSKNKMELELLTKQFDDIKALMKEDDLLKKSEIATQISENVPSCASELVLKVLRNTGVMKNGTLGTFFAQTSLLGYLKKGHV